MREFRIWFLWVPLVLLATTAGAQEKGWEGKWKEIFAGAKKEGKVVVMGSADPAVRTKLPGAFKKRFGISLEYLGGRGSENTARILTEARVGVQTVDAIFAGLSSQASLYKGKVIEPIKPVLMLPEVVDPSKWKIGKIWFVDPEQKFVLRLYNYLTTGGLSINTQHAKSGDFPTIKNVLKPKWKGKIGIRDPRRSGSGAVEATRFYRVYGEEFVKRLFVDQKPLISNNKRQLADWLGHGKVWVSFAVEVETARRMKEDGLPIDVIKVPDMPSTLTAGNGLISLIKNAPHPNAARVFLNWIASKEGLEILGRSRKRAVTRNDIDESYALSWEIPDPNVEYLDAYNWEFYLTEVPKVRRLMRELLRSR